MSTNMKQQAVSGLRDHIEWLARNDRRNEDIAHAVNVLMDTLERYVRDDAMEQFYEELARLRRDEQA